MGDDENAEAPARQVAHERLDRGGRVAVERGRRLVEEQRARIPGQRPGDGHARRLAARELARVAIEEPRRQPRRSERLPQLRLLRRLNAVGEVRAHGAREHRGGLRHEADPPPQRTRVELGGVAPVDEHTPGRRLVEAHQAAQQARLPDPRRPDEGYYAPRVDAQFDPAQD